jgi:chemotaxis protein MotB
VSAQRRHKKHHHEEHENHERWLVSGYDMMTLLFAVFVVLFAISSTNVSKVKELTKSLQEAFSGPVLSGGQAMMDRGNQSEGEKASPAPPLPSLSPAQAVENAMKGTDVKASVTDSASDAAARAAELAAQEEQSFQALKKKIDALVHDAHLDDKVSTTVSQRGLKVRLLTDKLVFRSGSAVIEPAAYPTLDRIGAIIAEEGRHPVAVEGHTDDRPIHTAQYPSNWQLSGGRAAAVVQRLIGAGVAARRTSLAGYAAEHPVRGNKTSAGRARNRRVEIILTRLHGADQSHGGDAK